MLQWVGQHDVLFSSIRTGYYPNQHWLSTNKSHWSIFSRMSALRIQMFLTTKMLAKTSIGMSAYSTRGSRIQIAYKLAVAVVRPMWLGPVPATSETEARIPRERHDMKTFSALLPFVNVKIVEQTVELTVAWDAMTLIWQQYNIIGA